MKNKLLLIIIIMTSCNNYFAEITGDCIACMCEVITGKYCFNYVNCDDNGGCGPFRIKKNYWIDAGNITLFNKPPSVIYDDFKMCVYEYNCAVNVIKSYMKKYSKDCNGDGKINCWDYLSIHIFSPNNCSVFIGLEKANIYQTCSKLYANKIRMNSLDKIGK